MFTAISKPLLCSWGGRKGMFTNCPNIWTGKKANMLRADVFESSMLGVGRDQTPG